jgi:hypothetical protein
MVLENNDTRNSIIRQKIEWWKQDSGFKAPELRTDEYWSEMFEDLLGVFK